MSQNVDYDSIMIGKSLQKRDDCQRMSRVAVSSNVRFYHHLVADYSQHKRVI